MGSTEWPSLRRFVDDDDDSFSSVAKDGMELENALDLECRWAMMTLWSLVVVLCATDRNMLYIMSLLPIPVFDLGDIFHFVKDRRRRSVRSSGYPTSSPALLRKRWWCRQFRVLFLLPSNFSQNSSIKPLPLTYEMASLTHIIVTFLIGHNYEELWFLIKFQWG